MTLAQNKCWGKHIGSMMTVSYTHLDVYKRQGKSCAVIAIAASDFDELFSAMVQNLGI